MILYAYDLYPRDDPRDGARVARLTYSGPTGALQRAEYKGTANGTGSGNQWIRGDSPIAQLIDPRGLQYVRVREIDTGTADAGTLSGFAEAVRGGFWLEDGDFDALTADGKRLLRFGGTGVLAYLGRAAMAPHTYIHGVFTGQDPFDRQWRLGAQSTYYANGDHAGAMLWRIIYEAQHFRVGTTPYTHKHADGIIYTDIHDDDRLRSAIPDLVMDFDQNVDSDGNAWTLRVGDFQASVLESVYSVTARLMEAGLYVEMDPDTFVLRAWEAATHRTAAGGRSAIRTGASWGANVVRLQAPSLGTVATGNVKSDMQRAIVAHVPRTTLWAGGAGDVYGKAEAAGDVPWEGGYESDAADAESLDAIAQRQISARADAGDVIRARLKLGNDPASGRYAPWNHIRPDDIVTVHTGSTPLDLDEDTFPVAALAISLRPGGDWDAWADLGTTYTSMSERAFQATPVGHHSHPPNPALCIPGVIATDTVLHELTWTDGEPHIVAKYPSGTGSWPATTDRVIDGGGQGGSGGYVNHTGLDPATSPQLPAAPGTTYQWSFYARRGGGALNYPYLQVAYYTAADVLITADVLIQASSGYSDWTLVTAESTAPANAAYMVFGPVAGNQDTDTLTVTIIGSGSAINDGHPDLVGTAKRAARCDHTEHVFRDRAPTVGDSWPAAGYKRGTLWIQVDDLGSPTSIVGTWLLVDATAGTWLDQGGGSHDHDADYEPAGSVDDHAAAADPHAGYQKESEKGAASGYASLDGTTKVPIAQLPTGTTSTTVALGDHGHGALDSDAVRDAGHWSILTNGDPVSPEIIFDGTGDVIHVWEPG